MEYEARESKKTYIISTDAGDKRISFDKIGKFDTVCIDSVSYINRRTYVLDEQHITDAIDKAVESIKAVMNKMLESLSMTISCAPIENIDPNKIQIEKYDSNCRLKTIKITDDML